MARTVGGYTLEERLGQGAMATVFRARAADGTPVAVKLLVEHAADSRFEREVRALLQLAHPHLVRLIDAGPGPPAWLAMELIEGATLESLLRTGPLAPARAARLVGELALGLAHAHGLGLVHRDVKPANVLVRAADGSAVLGDFGLARGLEERERLTRTGALVGTPATMSPEQLRGEGAVGPPADVWGLGAVLYRCLTGQEPFPAGDLLQLMTAVEAGDPVPPRALVPSIPPELEAACLACLSREPAARPAAAELARRLLRQRAVARTGSRAPALLFLAAGAAAVAVFRPGCRPVPEAAPIPLASGQQRPRQSLVLQPGPLEGQDTYLQDVGLYGDDNFGVDEHLSVGDRWKGQTGDFRSLLRFDLSRVPPGAQLEEARLELWIVWRSAGDDPRPLRVRAHALAGPWTEGSSSLDAWVDGVVWDASRPPAYRMPHWPHRPDLTQPGVLRDGTGPDGAIGELELEIGLRPGWVALDVAPAVQGWLADPSQNHGLRLSHADEGPPFGQGVVSFASSDAAEEHRPKLVLTWRGPPPLPSPDPRRSERDRRLVAAALIAGPIPSDPAALDQSIRLAGVAVGLAPAWGPPYLRRMELMTLRFPKLAGVDLRRLLQRDLSGVDPARVRRGLASLAKAAFAAHPDEARGFQERFRADLARLEEVGFHDPRDPVLAELLARLEEK